VDREKQTQFKANLETEDRIQKTELRRQETEDSKIMAKDKPNLFYNCLELSTNRPFLCKTKPICGMAEWRYTLVSKGNMRINPLCGCGKTKPIQSQTKPIFKAEGGRQSIGLWLRCFAGGKLDTEINFSLWPDKKFGWLTKSRVAGTMETKCAISPEVA
jgi:hypothetical protein